MKSKFRLTTSRNLYPDLISLSYALEEVNWKNYLISFQYKHSEGFETIMLK